MKNRNLKMLAGVVLLLGLVGNAMADGVAAIATTDIVSSFTNQVTPITAVLTASLGLAVLVAAFGWIKRAAK